MCGVHFCGPCQDAAVAAWARGETHELPAFGDFNQRMTAIRLRRDHMEDLVREGDIVALKQYPEWIWANCLSHVLPKFADVCVREQAIDRRRAVIVDLYQQGKTVELAEFPEWKFAQDHFGFETGPDLISTLETLPFPARLDLHGRNSGKRRKLVRKRQQWRQIHGSGYQRIMIYLVDLVGCVGGRNVVAPDRSARLMRRWLQVERGLGVKAFSMPAFIKSIEPEPELAYA